jgi:hypothetical protein
MATTLHPSGDALHAKFGALHPDVHEMKVIAALDQATKPGSERSARQRRLECEADAPSREITEPLEHDPPGRHGDGPRVEGRKAARDHVGVDEFRDSQSASKHVRRDRRFPGAIRPGDNDNARSFACYCITSPANVKSFRVQERDCRRTLNMDLPGSDR